MKKVSRVEIWFKKTEDKNIKLFIYLFKNKN